MTDPMTPNPTATEASTDAGESTSVESTVLGGDAEATGEEAKADATTETKAAETTEAKAVEVAGPPEKYELAPPDGFEAIDTDVLSEAEPILRELNLTNDQANKLMPFAGALVKKTMDRAEAAITDRAITQRKEWANAYEADPEIGGANKADTEIAAARAFDHYGLKKGEGLRQLLDESGLGNHPDMIRFVSGVGRDLAEGSFDRGDAVTTPKAPEQKLYGSEFQPKG